MCKGVTYYPTPDLTGCKKSEYKCRVGVVKYKLK